MARFNQRRPNARFATGPMRAEASTTTHEGGAAYALDPKSELFTLGVTNFVGQDTYYEKADTRDARYISLIRLLALEDPEWLAEFLVWLRSEANMRTAAITGLAEAVHERITRDRTKASGIQYNQELSLTNERTYVRKLVSAVLQRPDEPGEFLGYWRQRFNADRDPNKAVQVPTAVKRGLADVMRRMGNERNFAKYDSASRDFRWGDLLNVTHAKPRDDRQRALFNTAIHARYGNDVPLPEVLEMLTAREELTKLPVEQRRPLLLSAEGPARLRAAGMTWEALAGWLQGPMDADAWKAILPSMGYMARIRNLRNLDEAGIDKATAAELAVYLADPAQVARSRQLPYRFLSAYLATNSDRWRQPLADALDHSTRNIPELGGRTLVLIDTSGSMGDKLSKKSLVSRAHAAALFGVALAVKGEEVDMYGFASGTFRHDLPKGCSALRETEKFIRRIGEKGHGTEIVRAVNETYNGHDRVVLFSDEQTFREDGAVNSYEGMYSWAHQVPDRVPKPIDQVVPAHVPFFAFNLGGYGTSVLNVGRQAGRHQLGGLSDQTFKMMPLLERGASVGWPWEVKD